MAIFKLNSLFLYNQGSGFKAFAYFYRLTYNVAECYGSICHVTTHSIWFFQKILRKSINIRQNVSEMKFNFFII